MILLYFSNENDCWEWSRSICILFALISKASNSLAIIFFVKSLLCFVCFLRDWCFKSLTLFSLQLFKIYFYVCHCFCNSYFWCSFDHCFLIVTSSNVFFYCFELWINLFSRLKLCEYLHMFCFCDDITLKLGKFCAS